MVGSPPVPPPPPPPPALVPQSWRKTANPHSNPVQHPAKPASPGVQRPSVDPQALQHAATRLRKTQHGQSLRSDEPHLSHGGLDGENQSASHGDRENCEKLGQMGEYQAREQIHAPSPGSDFSRSIGYVHGRQPSIPLNNNTRPLDHNTSSSTYHSTSYSSSSSSPQYSTPSKWTSPPVQNPPLDRLRSSSNASPWLSEIENSVREATSHLQNSIYSTPNKQSAPQPSYPPYSSVSPSENAPGILYSTISKMENTSSTPSYPSSSINQAQNDLTRQLRDSALTQRQREANTHRTTTMRVDPLPFDARSLIQEATKDPNDEITRLVSQMHSNMAGVGGVSSTVPRGPPPSTVTGPSSRTTQTTVSSSSYSESSNRRQSDRNSCIKCHEEVTGAKPGCTALNNVYHVACFTCSKCNEQLAGASFYNVDGEPICEKDYVASLDRCSKCGEPISDRLLRAVGGAFHVTCFTCVVCNVALDGIPFTTDPDNRVHCVPCFHEAFAPRCTVCSKPIVPVEGEKESVRVVAMDKSFHVQCYRCEDCGLQLSSKIEGQGCYPLDSHLYCKTCNGNRLRLLSTA